MRRTRLVRTRLGERARRPPSSRAPGQRGPPPSAWPTPSGPSPRPPVPRCGPRLLCCSPCPIPANPMRSIKPKQKTRTAALATALQLSGNARDVAPERHGSDVVVPPFSKGQTPSERRLAVIPARPRPSLRRQPALYKTKQNSTDSALLPARGRNPFPLNCPPSQGVIGDGGPLRDEAATSIAPGSASRAEKPPHLPRTASLCICDSNLANRC